MVQLPINKYVAKLNEQQDKLNVKKYYTTISEININLSKIHQSIARKIDIERFKPATNYVNQYISHTSIWNLKFLMNLENPEVAMLQIFHLEFIFAVEQTAALEGEKAIFHQQADLFYTLNAYSDEHMEKRKYKMYKAIEEALLNENENNPL